MIPPLLRLLLLSVLCLAALCPAVVCAIPFSAAVPPTAVLSAVSSSGGLSVSVCWLDASSRGISSISSEDLWPYDDDECVGGIPWTAVLLCNNSLSSLPPSLFVRPSGRGLTSVSLSGNNFSASQESTGNFFSANHSSNACVFCFESAEAAAAGGFTLDLSFNPLGPAVPSLFSNLTLAWPLSLMLMGCGIESVPTNAFNGSSIAVLDLSFNDLSNAGALHAGSFNGLTDPSTFSLGLSNCNLRSQSMVAGVFDTVTRMQPTSVRRLYMSNVVDPADIPSERFPLAPLLPNFAFAPQGRILTSAMLNPPGQAWMHRPPTFAQFLSSWGNLFVDFPSGILHSSLPSDSPRQDSWTLLEIGEVVSMQRESLANGMSSLGKVVLQMAPSSVALGMLPVGSAYCPVHSVTSALTWGAVNGSLGVPSVSLFGYDLPLPSQSAAAQCGSYPVCIGCGGATQSTQISRMLSIEPALIDTALARWFIQFGSSGRLEFVPPVLQMWHTNLNRSDWFDSQYFCAIDAATIVMPALPFTLDGPISAPSFPFPTPSNLLACLRDSPIVSHLDWSLSTQFSANMLTGLNPLSVNAVRFIFNLDALYTTRLPVQLGLFDPLPEACSIEQPTCFPTVTPACMRIQSRCPYIVNGVCQLCPMGYFQRSRNSMFYCSACPAGSSCNATLSLMPMPCPAGTYQSSSGRADCVQCPVGSYNELEGQASPAACLQCAPGSASAIKGADSHTACLDCPAGRSSNAPGVATCPLCGAGLWQDQIGEFACNPCPAGTFGTTLGAMSVSNCTQCPVSAPASPMGSSTIGQCATDVTCPPGLWTSPNSVNACEDLCPVGSFCLAGVSTPCPMGSYQDVLGQSTCKGCGAGNAGWTVGSARMEDGCSACPLSTWSSTDMSIACTPCEAGSITTSTGSTNSSACVAIPLCMTAESIAQQSTMSDGMFLCPMAGPTAIPLTSLMTGGTDQLQAYLVKAQAIMDHANRTAQEERTDPKTTAALLALAVRGTYGAYFPLRQADSLRIAAFGSDPILSASQALTGQSGNGAKVVLGGADDSSQLPSASLTAIIASLIIVAFLPWALYRMLPKRVVVLIDQFSAQHKVGIGMAVLRTPTQFGAIVSWSFFVVALLVALLLGFQSNRLTTVMLLPPSASSLAGSARAAWQLTMRVYPGQTVSSMAGWCQSDGTGLASKQAGFDGKTGFKTVVTEATETAGASCAIAVDCLECAIQSSALATFTMPYSAQLIEWELFVTSAEENAWVRRYGVLTQLPGRLLPTNSELMFSAMESYYSDERSEGFRGGDASDRHRSGFELNFVSFLPIEEQSEEQYTAGSTVTIVIAVQKSDVILQTTLTDKQTPLQILTLIASAVVSLFSIFAIAFRMVEFHVLRRLGINVGPVHSAANANSTAVSNKDHPTTGASDVPLSSITTSPLHRQDDAGPSDGDRAFDAAGKSHNEARL